MSVGAIPRTEQSLGPQGRLVIARTYDELSRLALDIMVETLQANPSAAISLTTGRTPSGAYRGLRAAVTAGDVSVASACFVSSEEYVGVGADDRISLFGWLCKDLLTPLGVAPATVQRLAGDAPDAAKECRRFDAAIARIGGLDLVIQSIGVNGHFGFNEPGSAPESPSRVVRLDHSTRVSNRRYWGNGVAVPTHGLTMGVRLVLGARHVVLLAAGAAKAKALAQAIEGPIEAAAPCSLLRRAARLTIIADRAAAARLAPSIGSV